MEKKTVLLLRRIFGIILSLSIISAGVCLIAACLSIYYSGDNPYSLQSVKDAFSGIAVPVFVCVGMILVSFILDFIFPLAAAKKNSKINAMIREALLNKKAISDAPSDVLASILKQRKSRMIHTLVRTLIICVCAAIFLIYALNPENFHSSNINSSMISAMWVLIPCVAVPFGYSIFTAYFFDRSLAREIELIKTLPNSENIENKSDKNSAVTVAKIAFLVIGAALMIYGLAGGGTADVLTKAMNICTECIGLG